MRHGNYDNGDVDCMDRLWTWTEIRLDDLQYQEPDTDLKPVSPAPDLKCLEPFEADCIDLYYNYRKSQEVIAKILNTNQPSIRHTIEVALRKVKYFNLIKPYTETKVRELLLPYFKASNIDKMVITICMQIKTANQLETAKRLHRKHGFPLNQSCVYVCLHSVLNVGRKKNCPELIELGELLCNSKWINPKVAAGNKDKALYKRHKIIKGL